MRTELHRRIGGVSFIIALGAVAMSILSSLAYGQVTSAGKASPPTNLRCEYLANPLGIDVQAPRLSWQVQDTRRGAMQTAFQVIVSTDEKLADSSAVVWDSGKVESDQSIHVVYQGKPLASGQRYYWKVRTFNGDEQPTAYSRPAWWEMALLSRDDWKARWITARAEKRASEPVMAGAKWIWCAQAEGDKKDAWFRRTFSIDAGQTVAGAEISVSADNGFILFINGQQVGHHNVWNELKTFDVVEKLGAGNNLIALKGWNADGPFGLIVSMRLRLGDGRTVDLKTDGQWKTSPTEIPGWEKADFNDSAWSAGRVIASFGDAPWSDLKTKIGPRDSFCVRRAFQAKGPIARARAYVTGLGLYKLHLNGQPIGEDLLSPGWTDYRFHLQYQTYDVTDKLRQGDNAVGAILGNGWWSSGLGWASSNQYSDENLRLLMQLDIQYADGSREIVATGDGWQTHLSPITRNTLYHGETHDARLEMPGWDMPGFDAAEWSPAEVLEVPGDRPALVAEMCEPIRITQELEPAWISEPTKGVFIFDFGQNASGRAKLKVRAATGTKIRLRFGEELDPSGQLYRDNYRTAEATDYYICKGSGEEVWAPLFTYRGFRYCEVTGLPARPEKDALTFQVFHTAVQPAGFFQCSHPMLNQIFRNIMWGQRSNIHSVPTDCPQRDERLGWMGDALVFGPTSCWNMQMAAFYTKWLRDVRDTQDPKEGWVTDVAPAVVVTNPAAPGWGDAAVATPWYVYEYYGDTRILEECYDMVVRWVEYMHSKREEKSGLYERKGYGDWVATVESPTNTIGAEYYYYSTKLVSQMAAVLGKKDDAEKYAKRADEIAALFNKAFLNAETNNYPSGTQTANLLPLHFGMVPDDRESAVLRNIVDDIKKREYHLSTGFLGTAYLMTTLADFGQQEVAYRLATQTTCPSWGYMLRQGATTMWERWDTDKWGPGMNSRNHYAFGAVARWMVETLGGINIDPAAPGFKRIIIRPRPAGDLMWAGASYASIHGPVSSQWRRTPNELTLDVIIPANTTARVFVPTLGRQNVTVLEGGTPVFADGAAAGEVSGVRFKGVEDANIVFQAGSGQYRFEMKGR